LQSTERRPRQSAIEVCFQSTAKVLTKGILKLLLRGVVYGIVTPIAFYKNDQLRLSDAWDFRQAKLIIIVNVIGTTIPYTTPLKSNLRTGSARTIVGNAAKGTTNTLEAIKARASTEPGGGPSQVAPIGGRSQGE
jgi:hypothetical protein